MIAAAAGDDDAHVAAPAAAAQGSHGDHAAPAAQTVAAAETPDPLESYAGMYPTGADADALAQEHAPFDATLPPAPAGDIADVQLTLEDKVIEIAPGIRYTAWT